MEYKSTDIRSNIDGFKYTNDIIITDVIKEYIILDDTTLFKQLIMISFNIKKSTNISIINDSTELINYNLIHNGIYTIIVNYLPKLGSNSNIKILLATNICDTVANEIGISYYGTPIVLNQFPYEVIYSFDENYFIGGFASIYSLIVNTRKINEIRFNICIPEKDFREFLIIYGRFVSKLNINLNISIILVNNLIVDDVFLRPSALKRQSSFTISNMSRLLIGQFLDYDLVMYIDADTIVQNDITTILDKIKNKNLIISGKMSHLCFKNLLNSKYYNDISASLNKNNINLERNIIYTGTLFINPRKYKAFYKSILDLVSIHNSLKWFVQIIYDDIH